MTLDANTSLLYGKLLKEHTKDLVRRADRTEDRGRSQQLRQLAGAIEWALVATLPRHCVMEFPILYRAAQNDLDLYKALTVAYGSQENVEVAATMLGLTTAFEDDEDERED